MATTSSARPWWIGPRGQCDFSRQRAADLLSAALWFFGAGGLALLAGLAILLTERRLSGALTEPLSVAMLAATGIVLAAATFVLRKALPAGPAAPRNTRDWLLVLGPTAAVLLCGWAVALPRSSAAGLVLLVIPLLAEEAASLLLLLRRAERSPLIADRHLAPDEGADRRAEGVAGRSTPEPLTRRTALLDAPGLLDLPLEVLADVVEELPPPTDVWQQLVRRRTPDGRDECCGWLRANFAAQQRTEVVHLAFCPPFETMPDWTAEMVDGPPLKIKQVQLLPFGVRLELRLDAAPRGPVTSLIRFAAIERHENRSDEGSGG